MGWIWLIYDERYLFDQDRALVLEACNNKKEALDSMKDWPTGILVRARYETIKGENTIVDEEIYESKNYKNGRPV